MNEFFNEVIGIIETEIKKETKKLSNSQLKKVVLNRSIYIYERLDNKYNLNHYIDFTVKNVLLPILVGISIDAFYDEE